METATLQMKKIIKENKKEYLALIKHNLLKEYEIENKLD